MDIEKKGKRRISWKIPKISQLPTSSIIAIGFLLVILTGTLLLMLPFSSRNGQSAGFLTSLFTATSASCVTGLVVADTYQQWSIFGQLIILCMIQVGGLGFMTFGAFFSMLLHRNIGLKERNILQESVNSMQIGGIVKLTRKILFGTMFFEGVGAILLFLRFLPEMGVPRALYNGIFHSISAFCNAGFDLMGRKEAYSSLVSYSDDIIVNVVVMLLIVIGGIGFIVWDDVAHHKLKFKSYLLHTKIVLVATAVLVFGGGFLFWLTERNGLFAGMGVRETVLSALFSSVTARTAGFNTTDTAALSQSGKLLTIVLMFIGGSPGSTAGGIKTTTIVVMLLAVWMNLTRAKGCNIFGRRLPDDAVRKAGIVFTINLLLAISSAIILLALQPFPMDEVLFEVFSAIGTVGMTTGITRDLCTISRVVIIFLMYLGRVGSLTFALSFTERRKADPLQRPTEKILIG